MYLVTNLKKNNQLHISAAVAQRRQMSSGTTGSGSVDEAEMRRFQQWAKAWWVPGGEYEALHRMNDLRVPLITNPLANMRKNQGEGYSDAEPLLGLNILDIGCGGGILSEVLEIIYGQFTPMIYVGYPFLERFI